MIIAGKSVWDYIKSCVIIDYIVFLNCRKTTLNIHSLIINYFIFVKFSTSSWYCAISVIVVCICKLKKYDTYFRCSLDTNLLSNFEYVTPGETHRLHANLYAFRFSNSDLVSLSCSVVGCPPNSELCALPVKQFLIWSFYVLVFKNSLQTCF